MVQWFSEAYPFRMFHILALAPASEAFSSVHVHPCMDDLSYGSRSSPPLEHVLLLLCTRLPGLLVQRAQSQVKILRIRRVVTGLHDAEQLLLVYVSPHAKRMQSYPILLVS